jgi:broad specificity phosphatase PhoE
MSEEPFRLYIARHGITVWNREMRFQGHTDVPLDEEGREQARRLSQRLLRLPHPPRTIWASDLSRARHTAEAVAIPLGLAIRSTPALRETHLGEWEGLKREEIIARGEEAQLQGYIADPAQFPPPGGESLAEVWERMQQAIAEIRTQSPQGPLLIVGHGGSLRSIICQVLDLPMTSVRRMLLDNASLTILEEHSVLGGPIMRLRLFNDTSHLSS